jgi:hypothetical protein
MNILLQKKDGWNRQFRPFSNVVDFYSLDKNQDFHNSITMGNFDFVEKTKNMGAIAFENPQWFQYSYYSHFFGEELLNSDYIILPAKEINRLKFQTLCRIGKDCKIFVRPNSGYKIFTGQVLDILDIEKFSEEYKHDLIVIAEPVEITGEWRFVVSQEREVLGGSLYRFQDNNVSVAAYPPKMLDYLKAIIKDLPEFPNPLLTIDVASINDKKYKIIECNAFSTSGLYEIKPEPITEYISNL